MMGLKELRYNVMLALYFPILLYAFSTFEISEDSYAVQRLEPVVVGEQTVVLGQHFTANAFLAVAGGQGQDLEGRDDLGTLGDSAFYMETARLLAEDEYIKDVSYAGRFRFTQVDGEITTIPVEGTFRVRRPEIVATSEATQTLYRECLNRVRIEVPGLEGKTLKLAHGGGHVLGRSIALSPGGSEATVRVHLVDSTAGDVYLGSKSFAVIDPPRPEIRVTNAGREVRNGDNVPKQRALLSFEIQPDQEFLRRYPGDAKYSIRRAAVFLRKGLTASEQIGTVDLEQGNTLMLTRVLRDARPGDRLLIRLEGVYRVNHAGRSIAVPLSEASLTFGFVVS